MIIPRLTGLLFCALFIAYGIIAQDIQLDFWAEEELFNARTFPTIIAIGGTLVSLLFALFPGASTGQTLRQATRGARPDWQATVLLILVMFLYGHLLDTLGFIISTSLMLMAGFFILGERRPLLLALVGVGLPLGFYTLITLLGIHLEAGIPGWT